MVAVDTCVSVLGMLTLLCLQADAAQEPHTVLEKYKDREQNFLIFLKEALEEMDQAVAPYFPAEKNELIIDSAYKTFTRRVAMACKILMEELTSLYAEYNFERWPVIADKQESSNAVLP